MKKFTGIVSGIFLVCFASVCRSEAGIGPTRVVAYNTWNNPDDQAEDAWFTTVFSAITNESVNGIAKRPDIVAVSETDTGSSARLVALLNDLYGVSTYDIVTSSHVGGDRTGVVYDASTLTLLDSNDLTEIGTHPIVRAHFRRVGCTGPDSEFYVYAVHLKSGSSGTDKSTRAAEAANLRSNADALGEGKHIIYAGDFNMTGSSEGAWTNMLAAGNGQAFDTADSPGQWRDNETFKWLHSQNPRDAMDDRFDLQFVSGEFLDGEGLEYIPDSYHVFGNNGTHTLNDSISTGAGASPTILAALEDSSDHLPIVADYHILEPATRGDVNGDGNIDNLDITPFIYALTNSEGTFDSQYPDGQYWAADCHEDGNIDNLDITPFVNILAGGGQVVPEPLAVMLLGFGALAMLRSRKR